MPERKRGQERGKTQQPGLRKARGLLEIGKTFHLDCGTKRGKDRRGWGKGAVEKLPRKGEG